MKKNRIIAFAITVVCFVWQVGAMRQNKGLAEITEQDVQNTGIISKLGVTQPRIEITDVTLAIQDKNKNVIKKIDLSSNKARFFKTINDVIEAKSKPGQSHVVIPIPSNNVSAGVFTTLLRHLSWVENIRNDEHPDATLEEKIARSMEDLMAPVYSEKNLQDRIACLKAVNYLQCPELIARYAWEIAMMMASDHFLSSMQQANHRNVALVRSISNDLKHLIYTYMPLWVEQYTIADVGNVYDGSFSPDGHMLEMESGPISQTADSVEDHTVKIVDARTGQKLHKIVQPGGYFSDVKFSPDSRKIAACSFNGSSILEWNAASKKWTTQDAASFSNAEYLDFSPDGNKVVFSTYLYEGIATIIEWDAGLGRWKEVYQIVRPAWTSSVKFSPDNRKVVIGWGDGVIKIIEWNPVDHAWQERYESQHGDPSVLDEGLGIVCEGFFSLDSRKVLSMAGFGTVKIIEWSDQNQNWQETFNFVDSSTQGIQFVHTQFSKDGNTVVIGLERGIVKIIERNENSGNWEQRGEIKHADVIEIMKFAQEGQIFVTASRDGTAKIVKQDPVNKQWVERYTIKHKDKVGDGFISPEGNMVVTQSDDKIAKIVEWDAVKLRWQERQKIQNVYTVILSHDGRTVAMMPSEKNGAARIYTRLPAYDFNQALFMLMVRWAQKNNQHVSLDAEGWIKNVWNTYDTADQSMIKNAYPTAFRKKHSSFKSIVHPE